MQQEGYDVGVTSSIRAGGRQTIDVRLVQKKKVIQILDGGVLK